MDFLKKSNHREEMNTTVANASGSERCAFLPWQMLLLGLPSVKFRVIPWQMLLLILGFISVANASAYSWFYFRGKSYA